MSVGGQPGHLESEMGRAGPGLMPLVIESVIWYNYLRFSRET